MDHHQAGNADPQDNRRCDKSSPQPAGGIEPSVASEGNHDVPLQRRSVPTREPPAYLGHHGNLQKTTGDSTHQTARRQNLSEQKYRHIYLAANRRIFQQSGSTVWMIPIIQRTPFRLPTKTISMYESNEESSHKRGMFGSNIVSCAV